MNDTVPSTVDVRVGGRRHGQRRARGAQFAAAGTTITHYGFRCVYLEGIDDDRGAADRRLDGDNERQRPAAAERDVGDARAIDPAGHATQPPASFTEASLVR